MVKAQLGKGACWLTPGARNCRAVAARVRPRGLSGVTRSVLAPELRRVGPSEHSASTISFLESDSVEVKKEAFVVGKGPEADLRVSGDNVGEEHVKLELKHGRVFCTALVGSRSKSNGENSWTWVNGVEILSGVPYLVAPGSELAIGTESSSFKLEFEEVGGVTWMLESLIQSWAETCCKESRAEVENFFQGRLDRIELP